jgi:hypothetical protein
VISRQVYGSKPERTSAAITIVGGVRLAESPERFDTWNLAGSRPAGENHISSPRERRFHCCILCFWAFFGKQEIQTDDFRSSLSESADNFRHKIPRDGEPSNLSDGRIIEVHNDGLWRLRSILLVNCNEVVSPQVEIGEGGRSRPHTHQHCDQQRNRYDHKCIW